MPATPDELFAYLDRLGVAHRTVSHAALFTVEQSRALRGQIPGGHTKNLFLKDAKDRLWLVVAESHTPIDLKALPKTIVGGLIADVIAVIGSTDVVMGDVDR